MNRFKILRDERSTVLAKASSIIDRVKTAGRDLDPREKSEVETAFARIEAIDAELDRMEKSTDVVRSLSKMTATTTTPRGQKTAWAGEVARRASETMNGYGVKALTTGGIDIPQVISPVVAETATPIRLLELVDTREIDGNEFAYLRQTVRTNLADVVADGGTKPTSVYTFEDESDRARVIAHLSEPIPLRYLADHEELQNLLASQMAEDLYLKLESEVLTGTGTGEHFAGIAATSGIQVQPYTTDVLTTLRKARTALTTIGVDPTAWAFNPTDLETIDMMREDGATGGFLDGVDSKVFGDLPRIPSTVVPVGTAYLADWKQARIFVREGGRLDADASGDLFDSNRVKLRYEGRFGFAVLRPSAFVQVDLTAA